MKVIYSREHCFPKHMFWWYCHLYVESRSAVEVPLSKVPHNCLQLTVQKQHVFLSGDLNLPFMLIIYPHHCCKNLICVCVMLNVSSLMHPLPILLKMAASEGWAPHLADRSCRYNHLLSAGT